MVKKLLPLATLIVIVIMIQLMTSWTDTRFYLTQLTMSAYYAVLIIGLCVVMGYAGQISLVLAVTQQRGDLRRVMPPEPHLMPVAAKVDGQRGAPGARAQNRDPRRCVGQCGCAPPSFSAACSAARQPSTRVRDRSLLHSSELTIEPSIVPSLRLAATC